MEQSLKIRGVEIKMTYARLMHIAGIIGDVGSINYMYIDPKLQESVVRGFLSKIKKDDGSVSFDDKDLYVEFDDLTSEEALKIIDFVEKHETDFFTKAVESLSKRVQETQEENQKTS